MSHKTRLDRIEKRLGIREKPRDPRPPWVFAEWDGQVYTCEGETYRTEADLDKLPYRLIIVDLEESE
jgi:hypothetical protein